VVHDVVEVHGQVRLLGLLIVQLVRSRRSARLPTWSRLTPKYRPGDKPYRRNDVLIQVYTRSSGRDGWRLPLLCSPIHYDFPAPERSCIC
jgi:hypothetical protein